MRRLILFACLVSLARAAQGQIQVELKFPRVQYIAYEPIIATVAITNLAGRDIELRDDDGQHWFGFEVTSGESNFLPAAEHAPEPPLRIAMGQTVTRKVDLSPQFPVHDLGPYHVRANVFFPDLKKFFYSQAKVFQVTDTRPSWLQTVGVPDGVAGAGGLRTFSILSNRFPNYTKLYVRVEDKSTGAVYSTRSLGRVIAFDEPQVELDRANQLHVLHCSAPRSWTYSQIGLNGELLAQHTFMETKSRPRLRRTPDGAVAVRGGMLDAPIQSKKPASKLSARPPSLPTDD